MVSHGAASCDFGQRLDLKGREQSPGGRSGEEVRRVLLGWVFFLREELKYGVYWVRVEQKGETSGQERKKV